MIEKRMCESDRLRALSDEELYNLLDMLADGVAEDTSEAALFGDGPCGSSDRRAEYERLCAESRRRVAESERMCPYCGDLPREPGFPTCRWESCEADHEAAEAAKAAADDGVPF